jgi:signal transduction histidine kinase
MATPARSSSRTLADRWTLEETKPAEEVALERGLLTGIAAFRWVTWVWMAVVLGFDARSSSLERPWAAAVAVAVTLVWTLAASVLVRLDPARLLTRTALAIELVIAGALVLADWWVYGRVGGIWSSHAQSLGVAWPAASVLSVGVAFGTMAGILAGVGLGIVRLIGQLAFWVDETDAPLRHGDNQLAAAGTIVMYALVGGLAGLITTKLREAEREVAVARAREEVARTLHDGVLQTLAVVQRRTNDPELGALAREQEVELRQYLFGTRSAPAAGNGLRRRAGTADLAAMLRDAAAEAERRQSIRADIVLTDELPPMPIEVAAAIRGAVAESLVNASKHGGAGHAVVFVEHDPTDGIFCSIKDDGIGFDATERPEGIGLTRSIRGRIDEVGGTVEVDGRPGRGTEIRIRVPT